MARSGLEILCCQRSHPKPQPRQATHIECFGEPWPQLNRTVCVCQRVGIISDGCVVASALEVHLCVTKPAENGSLRRWCRCAVVSSVGVALAEGQRGGERNREASSGQRRQRAIAEALICRRAQGEAAWP